MKPHSEDSCDLAADLEFKQSKKLSFDPLSSRVLEEMLLDVYAMLRPRPSDYEERELLLQAFNKMAKEVFGNKNGFPIVEAFGSFIMDVFTATSDLDLSINFSNDKTVLPRDKKISILKKFAKLLFSHQRKERVTGVSPILGARIPVVKVVDGGTGIECDISVDNKDGILRSLFYTIVSSIDERFQKLSCLMKAWAKAHGINSSKDQTMNSLTIITLVAFHLQTRRPPVLPPFSALLKDGIDLSLIQTNAVKFKDFGKRNQESVAELFVSLFAKLSAIETLWREGLCASTYEGLWIYKTWKFGVGTMSVEDFVDRTENFARAVGKDEFPKIYSCIRESFSHLSNFMKGQIDASKLRNLLFKPIIAKPWLHARNEKKQQKMRNPSRDSSPNPRTAKRARQEPRAIEIDHTQHHIPTALPIIPVPSEPIIPIYGTRPLGYSAPQPSSIYSLRPSHGPSNMPSRSIYVPMPPISHHSNVPEHLQLPYASQFPCPTAHQPLASNSYDGYHSWPRRHH